MGATLDIELVRTFHAVARSGRFKTAAEQLHKSPAAISVHIQRLEAVAGGRLLDRDNQAVSLTALGKRLLASTADLLATHDRVLADLQGTRLAGRIKLGVPDEYAAHVIGDILPTFTGAWPNVVLEIKTAPSYSLLAQVQQGKLHAAVMAQPKGQHIQQAQLLCSTVPVWVGALTKAGEWPEPIPLALYAAECSYRKAMLEALSESARKWRVVLESPSSQAVKACVEAGLAISLLDRARVTDRMRILDGLPPVPVHEVVLVRSSVSENDEAIDVLAQCIAQRFRL